jgi:DNA-binding response OmpR family regulator
VPGPGIGAGVAAIVQAGLVPGDAVPAGPVLAGTVLAAQPDGQREFAAGSRTVDVHVSRLRHKLGRFYGRCLVTEYRVGYQFRPGG